jgi:transglutaminase-like putative cysteine protease
MTEPSALAKRVGRARPAHLAIAARTIAWLLFARAAIATRGFGSVRSMLRLRPVEPVERAPEANDAIGDDQRRALAWAFRILDRTKASCLPRSVVLERVCASVGIPAEIVIGVVTNDGFRAHAWVEAGGRTLRAGEQGAETWKALARFESGKARSAAAKR